LGLPLAQKVSRIRILQPLVSRDFRLLFVGQSVSLFGDQFYLVALPLLILDLTGSGLVLGTVLMLGGISRAAFDLVGGALSDNVSQKLILFNSNIARAVITALITVIAFCSTTQLWHLYVLSVGFGIVDAFFYPAFLAIIPKLIDRDQLTGGNALMRGTARLMGSVGPAAAGLVIAGVGGAAVSSANTNTGDGHRFATSFAIDTATFIFAAATVWAMKESRTPVNRENGQESNHHNRVGSIAIGALLSSIRDGLAYAWRDRLIRSLMLFIAIIEFSFIGPSTIGLALLAKTRFAQGTLETRAAAPYAAMLSSFGFGMLAGMILAGSLRPTRHKGRLIISTMCLLGLGTAALGFVPQVWEACAIVFVIGLIGGLLNITLLAWIQSRCEPQRLGRVLSVVMFGTSLVEPASYALSGILADISLRLLFVASAVLILGTALGSFAEPSIMTTE